MPRLALARSLVLASWALVEFSSHSCGNSVSGATGNGNKPLQEVEMTHDSTVLANKIGNRHTCVIHHEIGIAHYLRLWVDRTLALFTSDKEKR